MITIVNKRLHEKTEYDVYIGLGSPLGNPYAKRGNLLTPTERLEKYRQWLLNRLADKTCPQYREFHRIVKMASKHDVYLVCYCRPFTCEGDLIKKLVENLLFPSNASNDTSRPSHA